MGTKSKSFALVVVAFFLVYLVILPFATVKAQNKADPAWNISTVDKDPNGGVGFDSSIAVDSNGNPHISYTNGDLKYAVFASSILGNLFLVVGLVGAATLVLGSILLFRRHRKTINSNQ